MKILQALWLVFTVLVCVFAIWGLIPELDSTTAYARPNFPMWRIGLVLTILAATWAAHRAEKIDPSLKKSEVLWLVTMVPIFVLMSGGIAAAYPTAITAVSAHLRPGFETWWAGLFFAIGGTTAAAYCDGRIKKWFLRCCALFGVLYIAHGALCYARFDESISYRSHFRERVELRYEELEVAEVELICVGHSQRLHQVVLHFRGGRTWSSATDGMLDDEDSVRRLLAIIRLRAPALKVIEEPPPKQCQVNLRIPVERRC